MSDTQHLVEAARGGDREALDELFVRHQGRLLNYLRASVEPALAARVAPEDVLQETLLESARKLDAFEDRGPTSFYRWLVGIARFKLSEARRAQKARKRSLALEEPLDDSPAGAVTSPSGRAMRAEDGAALHRALHELSGQQGEAVRLRYLEGLSLAETAERLEISTSAVKALVSRGMASLASGRLATDPPHRP
jgi:RNA polymerase sigma-70 factor (ECF subfamily)